MAKTPTKGNVLRELLDGIDQLPGLAPCGRGHVNTGPLGVVDRYMEQLDDVTRANLTEIMLDPVSETGHTKIAKLIESIGGPKLKGEQVAYYRQKLRTRAR